MTGTEHLWARGRREMKLDRQARVGSKGKNLFFILGSKG